MPTSQGTPIGLCKVCEHMVDTPNHVFGCPVSKPDKDATWVALQQWLYQAKQEYDNPTTTKLAAMVISLLRGHEPAKVATGGSFTVNWVTGRKASTTTYRDGCECNKTMDFPTWPCPTVRKAYNVLYGTE